MAAKLETKFTEKNCRKALIGLILFSIITAAAAAWVDWWMGTHFVKEHPNISNNVQSAEEKGPIITLPNKLNIILMGVDERPKEDDPGRSDTLFVMMIDTRTRDVSILSVPRDTLVRIKGLGWDKINHAFMFGGVALTQQTTESFLGIPLNYYAKVDMKSFGRIVDAIGGITIDVEERMQYEDAWENFVIDLKPGLQRLDGNTALQYVRYRDEEGDIGRVRRQQKFIKAVLAEMNSLSILLKLPGIIREGLASLDTDIPAPLMLELARQLKDGLGTGFKANMVEGLPYYINDISYWVPDVMKTSQMVAEMQGISFSGNIQSAAQRLADEYRQNLPANAKLDDGAQDKETVKPPVKPRSPVPAPPPISPPAKMIINNSVPGSQFKDRLSLKK